MISQSELVDFQKHECKFKYRGERNFEYKFENPKDIKWKYIFFTALIIILIPSIYFVKKGNPNRISKPFDASGQQCGNGQLQEYPYIYFTTPDEKYLYRTVCVKTCPEIKYQPKPRDKLDCFPNTVVTSCQLNINYDQTKICMPTNTNYFYLVQSAFQISSFELFINDIKSSYLFLIIYAFLAIILVQYIYSYFQFIIYNRYSILYFIKFFPKITLYFFSLFSTIGLVAMATGLFLYLQKIQNLKEPQNYLLFFFIILKNKIHVFFYLQKNKKKIVIFRKFKKVENYQINLFKIKTRILHLLQLFQFLQYYIYYIHSIKQYSKDKYITNQIL
ncbi:hypothetical protein IMG5_006220 [Ichthyophthirius multifiliis]|uniref:Transmembrane protein n=1 Tax=Ichthyophthirius multifiliis TaxID=5932 RepID=G0QJL3_ICHMU|nr:hypothetical protein IMG5_006220 [Ichthyophthirius multifiliis]EGR34594.1 hypothetical protein IMG5_006220 [Ichthyophthirius multifiliis]|eukprot:XP_004039898.1 hypothetical protein IMG5_006220 [Ichthyophthirius multifiliis]